MFFKSKKLSKHITEITDITMSRFFLIEGAQKALLVDTGVGLGAVKNYVDSLTNLPYNVICTHGHVDHVGGAVCFDEIYLNEKDTDLLRFHTSIDMRFEYANNVAQELGLVKNENFPQGSVKKVKNISDGDIFDLGEVQAVIIASPGHTKGSVCVLIKQERAVVFGDTCNPLVYLFFEESCSVEQYKQSLLHIKEYDNMYDTVYKSHGPGAVIPKSTLDDCIEVCDDILQGKDDKIPYDFGVLPTLKHRAVLAKKAINTKRCDGKTGNVVYDAKKIKLITQ